MTSEGDILLLADAPASQALSGTSLGERFVRVGEPYDALLELGRRRWSAVLLTAPRSDLAGLCRAARRLQPQAPLFALCAPAGEPQVRPLAQTVLTDYFIFPPTRTELDRIVRAAGESQAPPAAGPQPAAISPELLATLVEACQSVSALERCVAELVAQRVAGRVSWLDAQNLPAGVKSLLLAAGDAPRALAGPAALELDGEARAFIHALQGCLPALMASAHRTETLHRLAITDPLTGAYNRRYFYHLTDQILLRAADRDWRVTLLLYDMDDFKRYNETYGYAGGDEILRETASLMKRTTRKHDVVARIGGDEFAVLFWDFQSPRKADSRPPDSAYVLTNRFLRAVNRHQFPALGPDAVGVLTISGGLARFPQDGRTCRELLRSANKALKEAKRSGGNSIRLVGGK